MVKKSQIQQALKKSSGNITQAAKLLGVPRETLRDRLHKMREDTAFTPAGFVPATGPHSVDLFISDLQLPFQHPDAFDFLAALKEEYKPNRIFNVGDLIDSYGFSMHDRDPEAMSVPEEMSATVDAVQALAEIFPEQYIAEGNHDMRMYRKAAIAGIPRDCLKGLNQLIGAPDGWEWRPKWQIEFPNGEQAVMMHNCGNKDATLGVRSYGYSIIQGHYATESVVKYVSNRDKLMWGMTVGCLIDDDAIAFNYNKLDMRRPILSVGLIENGKPRVIPMVVDRNGKWVKDV